jgi:glucosamine--fructose-6-phosphate aminotransferase (isomerizing)
LIVLFELARVLKNQISIEDIPDKIRFVIEENEPLVKKLAHHLVDKRDIFVLGHQVSYPISREIALKLKEISYIHAEGMMAGELKHGTMALIEPGVPVIGLVHETNKDRMESALKEVEAHGAEVFKIGNSSKCFKLPEHVNEEEFSILATIIGHLLSYYIADYKGLPIDKPRNLAKSVTVK